MSIGQRAMHGGINWGGGTQWQWANAIDLCKGSPDANRTIGCFQNKIRSRQPRKSAIQACDAR